MLTLHHCQFMVKCVQLISQIQSRYLKTLLRHQTRFHHRSIRWCCCDASSSSVELNQFWAVLQERVYRIFIQQISPEYLVDIVFNIYLDHSIKNSTRNKRRSGKQIKSCRRYSYSKTLEIFSLCQRKYDATLSSSSS